MDDMNKHNFIFTGEQLLVVPSRFLPLSRKQKNLIFAGFYTVALCVLSAGVFLSVKTPQHFFIFIFGIMASIPILLGHLIVSTMSARHNPLVVSERGITVDPQNCATWDEIKFWSFCTYKGLDRVGLSRKGEGTTINVDTGDFDSRFHGALRSRVNFFGMRRIFLSEDQQLLWRKICEARGLDQPFGAGYVQRV